MARNLLVGTIWLAPLGILPHLGSADRGGLVAREPRICILALDASHQRRLPHCSFSVFDDGTLHLVLVRAARAGFVRNRSSVSSAAIEACDQDPHRVERGGVQAYDVQSGKRCHSGGTHCNSPRLGQRETDSGPIPLLRVGRGLPGARGATPQSRGMAPYKHLLL